MAPSDEGEMGKIDLVLSANPSPGFGLWDERPRYGQETAAERDVSFPTGAYGEEEDIVISDVAGRRRDENGGNHCHLEAPAIEETRPAWLETPARQRL